MIKQAIEEYNNAERMFQYAGNDNEIDIAIELMNVANAKIKAYKKINIPKIKEYKNTSIKERILNKFRGV